MVTHHTALIYIMVLVSAADGEMTDAELGTIGKLVQTLPVFEDFDPERLTASAADCAELLAAEGGFDTVLGVIAESLPAKLRETAYALACDVAAADHEADQEELRILELIRHELVLDRLAAAAIERGVRARHARL
ncbi:MAG: tellurite resistance TerB family protein [Alphaproteobacteria bacterium]|jgi:tellurite resistance protein